MKILKQRTNQIISGLILLLFVASAQASTVAQYPWAQTLQKIMNSLDGPVAWSVAFIGVTLCGLGMIFLDLQGGAKWLLRVLLGIAIAFGASTIISTMYTFSGAIIH